MQLTLLPSLSRLTEVKIVTALCNHEDFQKYIFDLTLWNFHPRDVTIIRRKVTQLPLPKALKTNLSRVIRPIVYQVVEWWCYHRRHCRVKMSKMATHFRFTPEGTIEWRKTAEVIVEDESRQPEERYRLACVDCFDDQLPELWTRLPEEHKKWSARSIPTVTFWTGLMNGDMTIMDKWMAEDGFEQRAYCLHALHWAIKSENLAATQYFLSKLSDHERANHLVDYTYFGLECRGAICLAPFRSQIFYYLLMRISEDDRKRVFEKYPYEGLSCFLKWPFQPLFMGLAEQYARYIRDNKQYNRLLWAICNRIDYKEFDYRYLFHSFWQLTPESYRRGVAVDLIHCRSLFRSEEEDVLKTLVDEAEDKGQLVLRYDMWFVYAEMVHRKQWRFLKWFLELCNLSEEAGSKLKDEIRKQKCKSKTSNFVYMYGRVKEGDGDAFISLVDDVILRKKEL